jgi:hypothetical protein
MRTRVGRLLIVCGLVALGGLGTIRGSVAQGAADHPAHIHTGSCPTPGEVIAPLGAAGMSYDMDGTVMAGAEMVGQETGTPVEISVTTVAVSLADLVATPHAVVVHLSADEIGTYIACGDIGGFTLGPTALPIGLSEVDSSGYNGVAVLADKGDGTTEVTLFVTKTYSESEE